IVYSSGFRPRLDLTHHDGQVRKWLENTSDATAAARSETLDHERLADVRLGYDKIVDIEVMIVLGVGDRRFETLAHVLCDPLARELEVGERARNLLAADQLRDKVELLRRNPQHFAHSLGLVLAEVTFALAFAHDVALYPLTCRWGRRSSRCSCRCPRSRRRADALRFAVGRMAVKHPGRRELAELVTDHFLRHQHRYVLLPIVDTEVQTDELRKNGRTAAPDLDHLMTAGCARGFSLAQQ